MWQGCVSTHRTALGKNPLGSVGFQDFCSTVADSEVSCSTYTGVENVWMMCAYCTSSTD